MTARPFSVRSAMSAVALQWTLRGVGLLSLVVLARTLSPTDFGIVGLAMTAVAAVEIFSFIGLRQVLVRMPDPDRSYLDSAWTIQLALFTFLGVVLAASASWVASFYGEPAVAPIVVALSLRFLLLGLVNIGIVDFDRGFLFGRDLTMRLFGRIVSLAISVVIAVVYQSYWALVAGVLAQAACLAVASYVMHPFRPRFSLERRRELIGVSSWMFLSLAAQIVQTQADRVVLGRHAAAEDVGAFAVSKDLSEIFTYEIATALNRVSFVETSRAGALASQGERIGRLLGFYALVTAPMGMGIAGWRPSSSRYSWESSGRRPRS
jgi:lipopolysaccharide exporter